jgi:hypothetical protein
VPFQLLDHVFDPSLSEKLIELKFDRGLRHRSDGEKDYHHAEGDQERIEDTPGMAQRPNLAVPHGGHRGERHVERVEERVAFDDDEPRSPERQREQDR